MIPSVALRVTLDSVGGSFQAPVTKRLADRGGSADPGRALACNTSTMAIACLSSPSSCASGTRGSVGSGRARFDVAPTSSASLALLAVSPSPSTDPEIVGTSMPSSVPSYVHEQLSDVPGHGLPLPLQVLNIRFHSDL